MKKKLLGIGLIAVVLLVTACGKNPVLSNGDEVLSSIDGFDVTANDVYNELKKKYGTSIMINLVDRFIADKEITDQKEAETKAKDQLEAMKAQYAQYGQDFTAALQQAGFQSENEYLQVLILEALRTEVVENFLAKNLTEDEIKKYYENEIFGELTVRHILIQPKSTESSTDEEKATAEKDALAKAKEIITKLEAGEKFEDLAKEFSDDGTAEQGGLYANFNKQKVVSEFWDASYALKDGEYTKEPVKTTYGYHVILKVSAKEKPKFEDVKDVITDNLVSDKMNADDKIIDKTLDKVRKSYNLNIIDSDIDRTYKSIISSLSAQQ